MLISSALAASDLPPEMAEAPSMTDAFLYNAGFILLVVVVFYLVFIMPQQKRLAAQNEMLKGLKKGDKVMTAGGLVGTISALKNDTEVEVDLGNKQVVTVMRSYLDKLNDKTEEVVPAKAATKTATKSTSKAKDKDKK
jgi:preprotein translocase subunit YajC